MYTFDSEDIYKCEQFYTKKLFFDKCFSIVHISLNVLLTNLKFLIAGDDIYIEGNMSQNFVSSLTFYFMSKNGQLFKYIFEYFFLHFIKKTTTRTHIKNVRHCSLNNNVKNTYTKFHIWNLHNKQDMYVQKIKVQNLFSDIFIIISETLFPGSSIFISQKGIISKS